MKPAVKRHLPHIALHIALAVALAIALISVPSRIVLDAGKSSATTAWRGQS